MSAESQSLLSGTELKTLLTTIRKHSECGVIHSGYAEETTCLDVIEECRENPQGYGDPLKARLLAGDYGCDGCRIRRALVALEEYVERLQTDLKFQELRADTHLKTVNALGAELSRLRSTSLTPEEASMLCQLANPYVHTPLSDSAFAKLQSISGRSTESGVPK